jgi:predicted DNA-binding mobile mystery protein A
MNKHLMALRQLDNQLRGLNKEHAYSRPKQGWVRSLRKVLGMTVKQLAKRLDVDPSRVVKIETDELRGATTLRTLESVAEALDCKLVYVFVPRTTLEQTVVQQAMKIAEDQVKRVSHTMDLEAQAVTKGVMQVQLQELRDELLRKSWKHLWEK